MAESAHQLAVREQLNEQLEALADLDALLQSSEDETGEIQEVDTHAHPSVSFMDIFLFTVHFSALLIN